LLTVIYKYFRNTLFDSDMRKNMKNMKTLSGVPRLGMGAALPALFAFTSACVLSVSTAQAGLIAEWQFNSYAGGAVSGMIPDYGSGARSGSATANMPEVSGTTFAQIAGTTLNQYTANSGNNYALGVTYGSSPANLVLDLKLSVTGLPDLTLTYAFKGNAGAGVQTWSWSKSGEVGSYTTVSSSTPTTPDWAPNSVDFSSIVRGYTGDVYFRDTITNGLSGGTLAFDNILATAPEPVNVALGIFGGVFLVGIVARSRNVRNRVGCWRNAVVQWINAV
jgi:hypothetical protein